MEGQKGKLPAVASQILLSIVVFLGCFVFAELFIRFAIHSGWEFFRNPRLYTTWLDDEDQWKLRYLWNSDKSSTIQEKGLDHDPILGWISPRSEDNPLGIHGNYPMDEAEYQSPSVLFFGDSFVYGVTALEDKIPQQLDQLLSPLRVYNLGVVGYGTDQILLRLEEAHPKFAKPFLVVGLLSLDLDRALFSFRDAPKPRFTVENNKLRLTGTPIPSNIESWLEEHPPEIDSYILSFFRRRLNRIGAINEAEIHPLREEKKQINERILSKMDEVRRSRKAPILFVIFYGQWEFPYRGWREVYLHDLFRSRNLPFLDTKKVLEEDAKKNNRAISEFYNPPPRGHLNALGNRVVAEAVAAHIQKTEF